MKKHLKTLLAACLITAAAPVAKAQLIGISTGLVGGVGLSSANVIVKDPSGDVTFKANSVMGFEAGLYLKAKLGPIYVRPEVLYKFGSGTIKADDPASGTSVSGDFNINQLEVPVMIGFKIFGPLAIEAGPAYYYILNTSNSSSYTIGKNGFAYRVGANLQISRIMLKATFQGTTDNSNGDVTYKAPYEFLLGIGFKLGGVGL